MFSKCSVFTHIDMIKIRCVTIYQTWKLWKIVTELLIRRVLSWGNILYDYAAISMHQIRARAESKSFKNWEIENLNSKPIWNVHQAPTHTHIWKIEFPKSSEDILGGQRVEHLPGMLFNRGPLKISRFPLAWSNVRIKISYVLCVLGLFFIIFFFGKPVFSGNTHT